MELQSSLHKLNRQRDENVSLVKIFLNSASAVWAMVILNLNVRQASFYTNNVKPCKSTSFCKARGSNLYGWSIDQS